MNKKISVRLLFATALVLFTRIYGLLWGLPYLFHPDERNMAVAASSISSIDAFNPHFFAYNQFPLYLTYLINLATGSPLNPLKATILLRVISAIAGIVSTYLFYALLKKNRFSSFATNSGVLLYIFTPAFIQFSHFGTTESLLILFFLLLLVYIRQPLVTGVALGLSLATKTSGLQLFLLPVIYAGSRLLQKKTTIRDTIQYLVSLSVIAGLLFIALSPHTFLSHVEALRSFQYESAVATGTSRVFYTEQFNATTGVLFQLIAIFPYALGWPLLFVSGLGFLYACKKKPRYALYFLVLFIPSAFLFAKWTRFMIYAIVMAEFLAVYFIQHTYTYTYVRAVFLCVVLFQIVFGSAFMSIYRNADTRISATDWITAHIPPGSTILTESANVTDLPLVKSDSYAITSLFLYDISKNHQTQRLLSEKAGNTQYVILPSRRIFANFTCLMQQSDTWWHNCSTYAQKHPQLVHFYENLFTQKDYVEVARFSSFPSIQIAGYTVFEFPDETAEETWSVFDHPVVRIYKKR